MLQMGYEEAKKELWDIYESVVRDSERVVHLWETSLKDSVHKVGDDIWLIYEQVFIAAIDIGRSELALECFEHLHRKFPGSYRVKRLHGLHLEAKNQFTSAKTFYENLLLEDPSNMAVQKRLIAIKIAEGNRLEAIKSLKAYLELYQSDYEAWNELCDLYLLESEYRKAAFCMEEVLLSNPHNHLYNQKYAEIKYSEGSLESMEIALSYFAKACHLNNNNIRATYGLFLASHHLYNNTKNGSKSKEKFSNSLNCAARELARKYMEKDLSLPVDYSAQGKNSEMDNRKIQKSEKSL